MLILENSSVSIIPFMWDKVSRAYKTMGKIIALRIFVFKWQMDRRYLQPNGMKQSTNLICLIIFVQAIWVSKIFKLCHIVKWCNISPCCDFGLRSFEKTLTYS
jgi:hypothetical protein